MLLLVVCLVLIVLAAESLPPISNKMQQGSKMEHTI